MRIFSNLETTLFYPEYVAVLETFMDFVIRIRQYLVLDLFLKNIYYYYEAHYTSSFDKHYNTLTKTLTNLMCDNCNIRGLLITYVKKYLLIFFETQMCDNCFLIRYLCPVKIRCHTNLVLPS